SRVATSGYSPVAASDLNVQVETSIVTESQNVNNRPENK
ncbi:hypothetical protein L917_02408, partial [Phytophthora nicotianae]